LETQKNWWTEMNKDQDWTEMKSGGQRWWLDRANEAILKDDRRDTNAAAGHQQKLEMPSVRHGDTEDFVYCWISGEIKDVTIIRERSYTFMAKARMMFGCKNDSEKPVENTDVGWGPVWRIDLTR
jgi:hypothetical protein